MNRYFLSVYTYDSIPNRFYNILSTKIHQNEIIFDAYPGCFNYYFNSKFSLKEIRDIIKYEIDFNFTLFNLTSTQDDTYFVYGDAKFTRLFQKIETDDEKENRILKQIKEYGKETLSDDDNEFLIQRFSS